VLKDVKKKPGKSHQTTFLTLLATIEMRAFATTYSVLAPTTVKFYSKCRWINPLFVDQDATHRKQSGGVLSRPGILEYSMKGTNSKHENSSLVHIMQAYKIIALTPLVLTHLHVHTGTGNRNENL